ncbi:two-component system sensor histidine kinase NtrB [Thiovibrio sp. JS02]
MGNFTLDTPEHLREFFFAIIESLPGGILLADRQGNLLAVNQKASQLLGLAGSSIQDKSCWALLAQKFVLGDDAAVLRMPGGRLLCESIPASTGAEKRHVLISRNDLASPFLHVSGFFLSLEDVTFPTLMEMHLNRGKRFAAMREMAEAMSQELKNPLGSLELYASILKRELAEDPDNERIAAQMLGAVRTMTHLLNNFVTFSGLPQPEMKAVDLTVLLKKSIQSLQEMAAAHGILIESRLGKGQAAVVGDPALLEQLFVNIGLNAIESMPGGGILAVALKTVRADKEHGPLLEVKIKDNGCGIAPESLEKIFDPFFSTKGGKRGLGLAIGHYIAEIHNGLIEVESRQERGTTFRVLLPVASA